ncbi:MAG: hypothetical protein ABI461_14435 [Polyangiaceae bacterium]
MPYRNDAEALEARRLEVERELGDVRSRVDQFNYLKWRQKELEKELAAIEKSRAGFATKKLPMLANAKIASPCSADWEKMEGDDEVRFCRGCQKNVFNLSAMTAEDAEAVLQEKEGDLCARLYRRKDGTVLTTDCSVGVRKKWVTRVAGAGVLFGGAAAAIAMSARHQRVESHLMGAVAVLESEPAVMGSTAAPQVDPPPTTGTREVDAVMGAMRPVEQHANPSGKSKPKVKGKARLGEL